MRDVMIESACYGSRYFATARGLVSVRWATLIHAHESDAARYGFTSALAVQLLKSLSPALLPLIEHAAVTLA